jgi:hypothetical protein
MGGYEITKENIKKGVRHPSRVFDEVILEHLYRFPLTYLNAKKTIGTNVFDRDWDLLVILDTCRVDALREVADEYSFIKQVDSIRSVGGASGEWMARTFDEQHSEEIQNTAYLTANPHTAGILDSRNHERDPERHLNFRTLRHYPTVDISDIGYSEYLFKYEKWGEEGPLGHKKGMTPPRYVTERAISVGREMNFDRVILHYFQPHSPWVSNALEEERELAEHEDDWWNYLTETNDHDSVWNAYLDDLRYVLDDVKILLENFEADNVVLTADHGEAFGEYEVLGHNIGSLHPKVRTVPWAETSGVDKGTYTPTIDSPVEEEDVSSATMEEQLEALGYKK